MARFYGSLCIYISHFLCLK